MADPFDPFGVPGAPEVQAPLAPPVLPQAPVQAPPVQLPNVVPPVAQTDPRQQLMAIAALGALIGAGPRSGIGAGIGFGTLQAQQHLRDIAQQRENQRFQLQQQADAHLAEQQKVAAAEQQRREQALFGAIEKIKADAKGATDPESYQQTIEGGSLALLQAGYRIPPTRLMQMVPYVPPAHEKKYVDAWESWKKNPVNTTLLAQSPDKAILGTINVNMGTRAKPDIRPLPVGQVADLAGEGFAKDPNGQLMVAPKEATGTSAFDLKLKSLTDVFKATHRREPTAEEKDVLVDKAIVASKEKPAAPGGAAGGLTDEGLDYAATQYRVTGVMPSMGMGGGSTRTSIINKAAAQARILGQSPAAAIQKQAAYKADASSLQKIKSMSAAAESFETKADAQADLVSQLSAKVSRTQYPFINGVLQSGKVAAGNTDAHLFANALLTFTTEYAKIMEGSTGSAAGSSEGARRAASDLISTALNNGTIQKTLAQMQWEMQQTVKGYDATIDHITQRMGGASAPPATNAAPSTDAAHPPLQKFGGTYVWDGAKYVRQ